MHRVAPLLVSLLTLTACQGSVATPTEDPTEDSTGDPADDPTVDPTDEDACDPPSNPAAFEVGTGESCFERLSENGEIALMSGPQGGYHLWLSIGCADCGDQVLVAYGVRDPATGQALEGTIDSAAMIELSGGTWRQVAGFQVPIPGVQWDPEMAPPAKGTPIVLWAAAKDGSGEVLHEAEIPLFIGETATWDPCVENPDGDDCWF